MLFEVCGMVQWRCWNTVPLGDELKAAIKDGRRRILENCADLIEEATENFVKERFPRSCFSAMTAIEEAGKLSVLRFFAHTQAQKPGVDLQDLDTVRLSKFLRGHPEKAREAAASSLCINAGADPSPWNASSKRSSSDFGLDFACEIRQMDGHSEFVLIRGLAVPTAETRLSACGGV